MTTKSYSVLSAGLVVLDIILVNGYNEPLYQAGGTCCNVSCMLGYMGGSVSISGRLGTDAASSAVVKDLHAHKVNTKGLIHDLKETPSIIEKVNPETAHHSFSLRCPKCKRHLSSYRSITLEHARELVTAKHTTVDLFFFDRVSPGNLLLAKEARRAGALVFFEPPKMEIGDDFFKAVRVCHVVKYASNTLGKNLPNGIQYPDNIQEKPILEIITLGKDGLRFRHQRKKWTKHEPHESLNVVDTAGAGDWLSASFIHEILSSPDAMQALLDHDIVSSYLHKAQKFASYNCQFIGARGAMDTIKFSSMAKQIIHGEPTRILSRRASIINSSGYSKGTCDVCLI